MRLQTQALGDGRIQATVTAGAGALTLIRFGPMQHARIEVPGSSQTYGSNAELKPPTGATTLTFFLVADPVTQAGQTPPPTTVPLTIYDGCGPDRPWSTFFGGGASALQSTASVADAQVSEGNAGNTVVTFTVTLSVPSSRPITVGYRTADGTARAGQDYVAAEGTVTFNPGETSKTVTVQVRGNFSREPDKTFTITLSDPVNADIGRAQATGKIVDDDSLPTSGDDSYVAAVGQALSVGAGSGPPPGLLANDQAASQDARVVSFGGLSAGGEVTSNPAGATASLSDGGSLRVNGDGSFSFTSPSTFTGAFSFRYRVTSAAGTAEATVIVDVRSSPNAVDDSSYNAAGSAPLQISAASGLLANDGRGIPPGSIVSFGGGSSGGSVASTPAGQSRELGNGGTLTVNADGSFSFTAPSTAAGPFTFQYRLQNAAGADDATVTIQVLRGATVTTTSGATAFLEGGSPTVVDAGATVTTPGNANLTRLTATVGGLTDAGQETLAATTAGTSITASYVAPTLTLSGDETVAHYQQVLRSIVYQNTAPTPTAGARTIQLQATSGGQAGNTATKSVTVGGVNDAPVGTGTSVATLEDTPYAFRASDFGFTDPNDTPPNAFKAVKITSRPASGTLLLGKTPVADGQFVSVSEITSGPLLFVPASNGNGGPYATFTFQVQDDGGTSGGGADLDPSAKTMTVNVTPVNDAPTFTMPGNPPASNADAGEQSVPGFVRDVDDGDSELAQALSFTVSSTATAGGLTFSAGPAIDADGTLTYTAGSGTSGTATFSVTLGDNGSGVAPNVNTSIAQTFTITVMSVNGPPVAQNDSYSTNEDTTLTVPARGVLGTDTDPDGDALSAILVAGPSHGSLTLNPDGSFTYTPSANYGGTDTFTYKANDGAADSNVATATITVVAVNDPPVATNDTLTAVGQDSGQRAIPFSDLTGNDTAPSFESGQALTVSAVGDPVGGTVTLDAANAQVLFTPTPGFRGAARFVYTIQDDGMTGGTADFKTATATASFTVTDLAPTVSSTLPGADATNVPTSTTIAITFSESVNLAEGAVLIQCPNSAPALSYSSNPAVGTDSLTHVLTPTSPLPAGTRCQVTVTRVGVHDTDPIDSPDTMAAPHHLFFTTAADPAPTVTSTTPAVEAGDVPTSTTITLTFSESVYLDEGAVLIQCPNSAPALSYSSNPAVGTDSLTHILTPTSPLPSGTACQVTVTRAGVHDTDTADPADTMDGPYRLSFTTVTDPAPTVASTIPIADATGVATSTTITLTFSESVYLDEGAVLIQCPNSAPALSYSSNPAVGTDSLTHVLTPTSPLPTGTRCQVTVTRLGVHDTDTADPADTMAAPHSFFFTTAAANQAPANSVPSGTQTVSEDATLTFSTGRRISVTDSDAGAASVQVSIQVTNGTLTLGGTSGLSFTTGDGAADAQMVFTGSIASINAALLNMTYTPAADYSGEATLTLTTNDLGNTGAGGPLSDTDTVAITVNAVNDRPDVAVPPEQMVRNDQTLTFSTGSGNAIAVSDPDAGTSAVRILVWMVTGTATLNTVPGVTITDNGTASITAIGSIADLNAALDGLVYTPNASLTGYDNLTVNINDQGNTGSGGDGFFSNVVNILVTQGAVNDPPTAQSKTATALANVPLTISNLLDGASDAVDVAETPGYTPTFTLDTVTAVSCTPTCTTANVGISNLNAAAGSVEVNPPAGFTGTMTLNYTIKDSGSPAPGVVSAPATITVTVVGTDGTSGPTAPVLWFVRNTAVPCAVACDGRMSNPFPDLSTVAAINGSGNLTHPGTYDTIFVYESGESYAVNLTLLDGQKLVGQDATASLATIAGIASVPTGVTLPTMDSANAVYVTLSGSGTGVRLNNVNGSNTLRGVTITNSGGGLIGADFGTLTLAGSGSEDLKVDTVGGPAITLGRGTANGKLVSTSSSGSSANALAVTNVAGSIDFGPTTLTGNANSAVNLADNSAAITFGSLSITQSGTQRAFTARNNTGTIAVASGTIDANREAIEIDGPVGLTPLNVTLTRVNAGGGSTGINLQDTSGSFSVTGDGVTAGSGGTVENMTISANGAVYVSNAANVSLAYMTIRNNQLSGLRATGALGTLTVRTSTIDGNSASGACLSSGNINNAGVLLTGATGTVDITSSTLSNSKCSDLYVRGSSGTLAVNVTGSTLSNNGAANDASRDMIAVLGTGSSDLTVHVTTSTITGSRTSGALTGDGIGVSAQGARLMLEVDHSSFYNHASAISALTQGSTPGKVLNVYVHDNPALVGSNNSAISVGADTNVAGETVQTRIVNNVVGAVGQTNSGSVVSSGIAVSNTGIGTHNALIQGNTVQEVQSLQGITATASGDPGTLNVTVLNNTVDQIRGANGRGIVTSMPSGADYTLCANISGNTLTNIVNASKVRVANESGAGTQNIVQHAPTVAVDSDELDDANGVPGQVLVTGTINFGQPTCATPSF